MNSSVLNDEKYVKMIEQTVYRMEEKLHTISAVDWWDLFILMVRNKTIAYSTQKKYVETEVKRFLEKEIGKIEAIPQDNMTFEDKRNYKYIKARFKEIQEKEILGHQIRTRGFPKYEMKEPDIQFYAKLEKRSFQKTIIAELEDEDGKIYSNNENLIRIATRYYKELVV